jgi:hypothetical protein
MTAFTHPRPPGPQEVAAALFFTVSSRLRSARSGGEAAVLAGWSPPCSVRRLTLLSVTDLGAGALTGSGFRGI